MLLPTICIYVDTVEYDTRGVGSDMGLWLNVCIATGQIFGGKTQKGVTKYDRLNIKMMQLFLLNYAQKVIVLKSKPLIKFKTIQGWTFSPRG